MTRDRQTHATQAIDLRPDLSEVSRGRRFLAEVAAEAGFSEERVFDITVACSEAMANAIEHSPVKGGVAVRAITYPDRLEVEIEGPGEFQAPDRLKDRGNRGLGLPLMAKLSDHLALFSGPQGQTFVSLTFYKPGSTAGGAGALPPSFVNLSEENKLLDDVLRHLPDGFYVLDEKWRFAYANPAVLASLDTEVPGLLGEVIWELFPDFDREAREALETARAECSVCRVTARSGSGVWREWTAFPVNEGVAVFSRDITERRQFEQALRESEAALRGILDATQESVWVFNAAGVVVALNATAARRIGRPAEEILGLHIADIVPPELARQRLSCIKRVAQTGHTLELEDERAGMCFLHVLYPIFDRDGRVDRVVSFSRDVTERKRAEQELRTAAERFTHIFDKAALPMALSRHDVLVNVNEAWQQLFGYSKEEALGKSTTELGINADPTLRSTILDGLAERGSVRDLELPLCTRSGASVLVHGHIDALEIDGEQYLLSAMMDVTAERAAKAERERLLAEEQALNDELRRSEERFRLALKNAPVSLAAMDCDFRYVWAYNQRMATPDEVVGKTVYDLFPLEAELLTELNRKVLATGAEVHHGLWVTRPERPLFLDLHMEPMRGEAGDIRGIWIAAVDLTDQKLAESDAREQSEQRQVALDAAKMGWWRYDPVSGLSTWDKRYKEIFGMDEDARPNDEVLTRLHPDDLPRVWAAVEAALDPADPQPYYAEYRIFRPDGSMRWIEAHGLGVFEGEGEARRATSLVGTVEDLTERKAAARALEVQAELLANVQDPMTATDENFLITYWNRAAERVFGWTRDEVIGRPSAEIFRTQFPGSSREAALEELFVTDHLRLELVYERKDGSEIPVEVHTALLRDESGAISGTVSVQRDISARRQVEQALRRSEERTRLFLEVADAIAEWTDLDKVLDASLQAVVQATAHSRASIGLWDPRRQTLRVVASAGDRPMAPASAPLERFSLPMQEAIRTGGTTVVDYDLLPQEQLSVATEYDARYALLVPLVYHDEVIGVVMVDDPGTRAEFTDDERELVEGIAIQAAVAIENARLYEAQKNIADQLQRTIIEMPVEVPGLRFGHLYRSATDEAIVGGDFYDVFERQDGTIALLAGDVSGHGVNAARLATMVKASLAAFAQSADEPNAVLASVNRLLMRKRIPGFTSVLYAVYDPKTTRLAFCSAGHPNLLIARRDGGVESVGGNHTPLGIFSDWSCSSDTLKVALGDTLLLYTDGVTEARKDVELFGESRLMAALDDRHAMEVEELPHALLDTVLAFTGGRLQDDVAILAVRPSVRD
jgi:PAS domain S-box-containing protein